MMKSLRLLLIAMLAAASSAPTQALDRVLPTPRIKDNGDVRLADDLVIGRKVGNTLDLSGTRAARPGGISRLMSDVLDNEINIRDFGAKDDDQTPNTDVVQAAINAAAAKGRTLAVTVSADGTGKYRIGPNIDWKDVNLRREEGASFVNLDGSTYAGGLYGAGSLPGTLDSLGLRTGRRINSPGYNALYLNKTGTQIKNDVVYNGIAPFPYSVSEGEQFYFLGGQNAPSSGSYAGKTIYANIYNYSNGPGVVITCDATTNSQYLGNCTPSPTATNPLSGFPNVFSPARITMVSGTGVPDNTFGGSWDGSTIAMAAGTDNHAVGFTGASGRYQFRVVSGRSEFNPLSLSVAAVGTAATGGPQGGMNWYNECTMRSAISTSPVDQEGFLSCWLVSATKTSPGNLKDKLHNGSAVIMAHARIDDVTNSARSYPLDDGIAITGWSGQMPAVKDGGQVAGATYGAFNGLRIGGGCASIYCFSTARSLFQTGINIQDYETGIKISNPSANATGNAIDIAPGAGSIKLGDYIVESTPHTPPSSNSPCVVGQHAWDVSFEYRCTSSNHWQRWGRSDF